jgi:hypothetical protein
MDLIVFNQAFCLYAVLTRITIDLATFSIFLTSNVEKLEMGTMVPFGALITSIIEHI